VAFDGHDGRLKEELLAYEAVLRAVDRS